MMTHSCFTCMIVLVLTPRDDAIVILAYRLSPKGEMEPPLIKRLEMGLALHRQDVSRPIIVCGWRANKREVELGKYNEAELMRAYILERAPNAIVFMEPDSTSIQENLLFTRYRFPNLKKLTVVTAALALKRTEFHADMVFRGHAVVTCLPCKDGAKTDALREAKMLGDVKCMLSKLDPPFKPGQHWERLMAPSENGRLKAHWNRMRDEHHDTCQYYKHLHPMYS